MTHTFNFMFHYFRLYDIKLAIVSLFVLIVEFIVIKHFYPYPFFINDSYFYLHYAIGGDNAGIWPVGYSKFIRLVGVISHSDDVLIFSQLFFYFLAAGYFFIEICKLFQSGKYLRIIVYCFLFLNPAIVYIENFVVSDAVFISLSLIWITQLILLFVKFSYKLLIIHVLILILALYTRYQAIPYPIVSIGVVLWSKRSSLLQRLVSVGFIVISLLAGYCYIVNQVGEKFGVQSFSIVNGWQLANNALQAYYRMDHKYNSPNSFPDKFRNFTPYLYKYSKNNQPKSIVSGIYIWNYNESPLTRFSIDHNELDFSSTSYYIYVGHGMSQVNDLYEEFAIYLIRRYPFEYLQYYLLINLRQYFIPFVECMSMEQDDLKKVYPPAITWFGFMSDRIEIRTNGKELTGFYYLSWIYALIVLTFSSFLCLKLFQPCNKGNNDINNKVLIIIAFYLVINLLFSVWAAPVVLRYQLFNLVVLFSFSGMVLT